MHARRRLLVGALAAAICAIAGVRAMRVQAPAAPPLPFFEPPAGNRLTHIDRNGETLLPNGRIIAPRGRQFQTDPHPYGLALSRDGKLLATVNSGTSPFSVTLISLPDGRARRLDDGIDAVFMGAVFSPDGKRLYVSGGNEGSLLVFDTRAGELVTKIPLNAPANGTRWRDSYTGEIAIDTAGEYVYACDQANFRLAVISTRRQRVVGSVRVGRYPFGVALAPEGGRAFVANVGMFEYAEAPGGLPFPPFGFPSPEATDGTVIGGRHVPGLGDPNVPESFSVWEVDVRQLAEPRVVNRIKTGVLVGTSVEGIPALGGSAPNSVVAGRRYVYVSNGNNDSVSVIDRVRGTVQTEIALSPSPETARWRGVIPFGLALGRGERRLYVAESGINAVGVIDTATHKVTGHVPAGWFPSKVAVAPDGSTLYVANAKGYGSGPNAGPGFKPIHKSDYIGDIQLGTVSAIPVPSDSRLASETQAVLRNNGLVPQPAPPLPTAFREIRYVVYIVKENRTFDEVFGGLAARPGSKVRGGAAPVRYGPDVMPNHHALAARYALSDNFYVDSDVSADGHRWAVGNYPNPWVETSWAASYGGKRDDRAGSSAPGRRGFSESNSSVHPEDYLEAGSMWEHLERHHVSFRNFGEGFELAGNDEDEPHLPTGALLPANIPMPAALFRNTSRAYPGFNMNISDQYRYARFAEEFREFEKSGEAPRLIYLHLPNDHTAKERPGAGYPKRESYAADNDYALGRVIELLSHSRFWPQMAVFVTEDDAQSGRDSVDAHRSLLLVVGPWARHGYVSPVHANFGSILKTIDLMFGLPYLNLYDAAARDLRDLFADEPRAGVYTPLPPNPKLFDPAKVKDGASPVRQALDDPASIREELNGEARRPQRRRSSASLVRREKPGRSSRMKGAGPENCPFNR